MVDNNCEDPFKLTTLSAGAPARMELFKYLVLNIG